MGTQPWAWLTRGPGSSPAATVATSGCLEATGPTEPKLFTTWPFVKKKAAHPDPSHQMLDTFSFHGQSREDPAFVPGAAVLTHEHPHFKTRTCVFQSTVFSPRPGTNVFTACLRQGGLS